LLFLSQAEFEAISASPPLMRRSIISTLLILSIGIPLFGQNVKTAFKPPSDSEVIELAFSQTRQYLTEFQDPDTGVLYGSRLTTKGSWTSPAEVLDELPHPWGYGSRIADTVLHTGHMLVALLDAWEARPDPFLEAQIRKHFSALKMIGSLPETHPKPGKPALEGLVPRGPHPDDDSAWFDDSSMDQHTTYLISLAIYSHSALASADDQQWIKESLGKVGRRLEQNDWAILRADGETQAHVGFSWKGFNSSHASILLPSVLALYRGTGDEHWKERYEFFLSEAEGKRWEQVHPGPHVRINGHPIYANQNAFRVNAWYHLEGDESRRRVIAGLLKQSVEMQLARDFPGEFYRKYHPPETWEKLQKEFNWEDRELRGASLAWNKFRPEFLDHKESGLAALAHVRFPLGGFHMVLLSEEPALIQAHLKETWNLLRTVDLEKISAGETHYLFTVVGLHLYALHFRDRELDHYAPAPVATAKPKTDSKFGTELSIAADVGIGPTQDVAFENDRLYAIGKGQLHILDAGNPKKPTLLGSVSGLGSVRQIMVRDSIAYISSRQDGLFVVDASVPTKPVLRYHYDTIEFATGLAISGEILFVACRHYGVELVDISDPYFPKHLSTVRTGEAQSVVARDGFLYVGVWGSSEVVTVNYQDPFKPLITSRAPLDGFGDGVDVEGKYLYVATGHHSKEQPRKNPGDPGFGKGHGLEVFDLSKPAEPKWLSRIKFPPLYEIGNDTWRVTVTNRHAFVTDTHNGFFLIDVSDPLAMQFSARLELPLVESKNVRGYVGGLALTDHHLFLAGGYTDLHLVSLPDVAQPQSHEADTIVAIPDAPNTSDEQQPRWRNYEPGSQVYEVAFLDDDRAVVACGSGGIHLLSLWPEIKVLSKTETQGFARDVSVSGDLIFTAESAGGLSIRRIESGSNGLTPVGHFTFSNEAIRQVEVPGNGNFALLQAGASRFLILDLSNPRKPELVLEETRHGLLYGDQMMRGLIDDRYTSVFWHVSGLHWYDLKAQPKPVFSGDQFPERLGSSNGFATYKNQALATTRGGYLLLDRQEKRPATEVGIRKVGTLRRHLGVPSIDGDHLHTAHRAEGKITLVEIQDPADPVLLEEIEIPGNPARVSIRRNSMIIPSGYHGLLIRDRLK